MWSKSSKSSFMKFFNFNKESKIDDTSLELFHLAINGIEIINNYRSLNEQGEFEVLLCNSEIVLNKFRRINPVDFEKIQEGYWRKFESYISKYRSLGKVKNLPEFINHRFEFYADELNKVLDSTYIPGKIYNAFYEQTLKLNPDFNFDLINVMPFKEALLAMMTHVDGGTNIIDKMKKRFG
jgi:hypothetical protein